jgi:hypothetical protein
MSIFRLQLQDIVMHMTVARQWFSKHVPEITVILNDINCIFTQLQVDLTWNINLQSDYNLQF